MLRKLIWKEVLGHVLSTRFAFSVTVAGVLMLSSTWVLLGHYHDQVASYQAFAAEHARQIGSYETGAETPLAALSMGGRILDRRPPALSFLVSGVYRDLPRSFWISAYDGPSPETNLVENRLRDLFELVDFRFIVGVVFALLALVLSYDAVNGERQAGTLRMIFANPVRIGEVLVAKWISLTGVLGVAFLVSFLGSLLLAAFDPLVSLGGTSPLRLLGLAALSLLYLAVFIGLGIFLSTLFASPSTSIAMGLAAWVLLVFVVPGAAAYLGASTVATPSFASAVARRQDDLGYDYRKIRQGYLDQGDDWQTAARRTDQLWRTEVEPKRAANVTRTNQTFLNRKAEVAHRGEVLARLSPYGTFSFAAARLAGTGIEEQLAFERAVERYRQEFTDFIHRQEESGRQSEVGAEDVPPFVWRGPSGDEVLHDFILQAGVLAFLGLLLLAASYVRMLRLDVR